MSGGRESLCPHCSGGLGAAEEAKAEVPLSPTPTPRPQHTELKLIPDLCRVAKTIAHQKATKVGGWEGVITLEKVCAMPKIIIVS